MLQRWTDNAIAVVRIIIGVFMIYHGIEIFSEEKMKGYEKFLGDDLKMSNAVLLSYMGKAMELVAGICLTLGFLTRPASVLMAAALGFITFGIGNGRVYMEEQHPFMFVLFAVIFFFDGGSKWSVDNLLFRRGRHRQ
jgi:putative oxidoreductase